MVMVRRLGLGVFLRIRAFLRGVGGWDHRHEYMYVFSIPGNNCNESVVCFYMLKAADDGVTKFE